LLFTLIFRGVSIHVRSLREAPAWRRFWDWAFSLSSIFASLLIGVAMGNIIWGVPIDEKFRYHGVLWQQLHPYALLTGVTVVALFAMHGAIYLVMKAPGALEARVRRWVRPAIIAFVIIRPDDFAIVLPRMAEPFREFRCCSWCRRQRAGDRHHPREVTATGLRAFLVGGHRRLLALFGIGMFPEFIHARPDAANSLTAFNASSSRLTLTTMFTIAVIGMPLVLGYTVHIYRVFRGKVALDSMSY
jgi:cytochrome d ubiquinol oxidase subunit II